jgi:hypothetical protein
VVGSYKGAQKSSQAVEIIAARKLVRALERGRKAAKLSLFEIRSSPLPAWLGQIAHWIGFALFKFGVALGSLEALPPKSVIANRARLPRRAISATFSGRLRHAREHKHQCNQSNHGNIARRSAGDKLRHLGFLFNWTQISSA